MTGGNAAERSPRIVGGPGGAPALVCKAAALGVRLEPRPDGRLWADRPNLLPAALRDSLAAHRPAVVALLAEQPMQAPPQQAVRAGGLGVPTPPPASPLPGVPPDWCRGVARLATLPAAPMIPPRRWAVLAATSVRVLQDHGAALHAAGWGALDLFGLHPTAPMTHPAGWGLAWLLGEHGAVLDVSPTAVGMTREAGVARLALYKLQAPARAGILPAWNLPGVSA